MNTNTSLAGYTPEVQTTEQNLLDSMNGKLSMTALKSNLSKILITVFEKKPVHCQFIDNGKTGIISMVGNGVCLTLKIADLEGKGIAV